MIARTGLLALVLVTAVLLETVVFAGLAIAGHAPAVVALTVVAVALADGSEAGARYGFAAGLAVDLIAGGLLGLNAIVLVLVGWGTGVSRTFLTGPPVLGQVLVGGAACAGAVAGHGLLAFLLDPDSVTVTGVLRSVLATGLYSAALAPFVVRPVVAAARRVAPAAVGRRALK